MILARGPLRALETPSLSWNDAGEPQSSHYADCYFSAGQGDAETRHVFLEGSGLPARFAEPVDRCFRIAELGFGTGLNFLLSARLFLLHARPDLRLHYWSVDKHPLKREDLAQALKRWPSLSELGAELLAVYPPALPGVHRRILAGGQIQLDLVWAEAKEALEDLASFDQPLIDAWYLDGFAPGRNAAMWDASLFALMAAASRQGASVATYSAAGAVRRGLAAAGFDIHRHPGFGSKRECLRGTLGPPARRLTPAMTPWDLPANGTAGCDHALVLGAGLAGAHAAAALARRGCTVTVCDSGPMAGRASGNGQGVLFTRLSHQRSTLSEFSALAFLFAQALYRRMFERGELREGLDGELNGCLQQLPATADAAQLGAALRGLEHFARQLSTVDSVEALGLRSDAGFWQPDSGWLSPPAVCAALLEHPRIRVQENAGALRVARDTCGGWTLRNTAGSAVARGDVLVVAGGTASRELLAGSELPLRCVRGQTTEIPAPPGPPLRASLCHRGYVTPARAGKHCIGATFGPGDENTELRVADHRENLQRLAQALPDWATYLESLDPDTLPGRAETRCVSPDYLPLAGPVPAAEAFRQRYVALGADARQLISDRGAFQAGLYLSTAHGSRGLSYAALGAELIASQVFAEPAPVSRELQRAVAPARFLVRSLVRGGAAGRASA